MRHYLQIDLEEYFLGARPWEELIDFLRKFPPGSHTWSAQVDDDDLASALLDFYKGKVPESKRPGLVGWSSVRADLAEIKDLLAIRLHQAAGDSQAKLKPTPRPETAMERVKQERSAAKTSALLSQILPNQ